MNLLARLQELRLHPDFDTIHETDEWLDVVNFRKAEILSEIPVPFCCPLIAGARVATLSRPYDTQQFPKWGSSHRVPGMGHYQVDVHACPFCATPLPKLVLKQSPPPQVSRGDYNCETCGLNAHDCLCSHPYSIYEVENAPPLFAVTAVIRGRDRTYLTVSRKNNPNHKGLAGGKIEPGETPVEALVREVQEETGLLALDFHPIFDANDSSSKRCRTYEVTRYSGEISTKEAGVVEWVRRQALTAPGPFEVFNQALFHLIDPGGS